MGSKKSSTETRSWKTTEEQLAGKALAKAFSESALSVEDKLEHFPRFLRRQRVTRFLALYELFKKVISIKGSIVDCGVFHGFSLMSWSQFSSVLEPANFSRKIYGFDSFAGFPQDSIVKSDRPRKGAQHKGGALSAPEYEELLALSQIHDSNRFLGHIEKVHLVKGDITKTAPAFVRDNQHLLVSLLFLDLDLYQPTKVALETFVPRMPAGAIVAFDELDNPNWPGETKAMLEYFAGKKIRIQRFDFEPFIGFAEL